MGKIAQLLSRFANAINPEMYRAWYWDNATGKRAATEWCTSREELDREIAALPVGTKIIGEQTNPYGEIH